MITRLLCLYSGNTGRNFLDSIRPTEFDTNGMIKARRMPLGFAAKVCIRQGGILTAMAMWQRMQGGTTSGTVVSTSCVD